MSVTDELIQLFAERGQDHYGESVTTAQHCLQSAWFADQAGESDALVVACLVHDVGHMIHDHDEDIALQGIDAQHEDVGDPWLRARFPLAVSEPARLHVAAKRYLCAVDQAYFDGLSDASRLSLGLQGGPMSAAEVTDFEAGEFFADAVRLRKYDDMGKDADLVVPDVDSYRARIEALVQ